MTAPVAPHPALEVADVLRAHGASYLAAQGRTCHAISSGP